MSLIERYYNTIGSVTFIPENKHYNHFEVIQKSKQYRDHLKSAGIREGDRVILLLPNDEEFVFNMLGLLSLSATIIPLSPKITSRELSEIELIVKSDGIITAEGISVLKSSRRRREKVDISFILFTSGSTGKPKGVPVMASQLVRKIEVYGRYIKLEEIKNTLNFLPLNFGHGLISNFLFPLFTNNHVILSRPDEPLLYTDFRGLIDRYKISFFSSVPTLLRLILGSCESLRETALVRIHSASSFLDESLWNLAAEKMGRKILYNIYGATEMASWFAGETIPAASYKAGVVGIPWDSEIRLSDENELYVRSDYMFSGYIGEDGQITSQFNQEQWFATGDRGEIDTTAVIKIVGRIDDVINLGGLKCYPSEIENIIFESKIFDQVKVFPVEIQGRTRIIVAVVLKQETEKLFDDARRYVCEKLSKDKWPYDWLVLKELPTNTRGKIIVSELARLYLGVALTY